MHLIPTAELLALLSVDPSRVEVVGGEHRACPVDEDDTRRELAESRDDGYLDDDIMGGRVYALALYRFRRLYPAASEVDRVSAACRLSGWSSEMGGVSFGATTDEHRGSAYAERLLVRLLGGETHAVGGVAGTYSVPATPRLPAAELARVALVLVESIVFDPPPPANVTETVREAVRLISETKDTIKFPRLYQVRVMLERLL